MVVVVVVVMVMVMVMVMVREISVISNDGADLITIQMHATQLL